MDEAQEEALERFISPFERSPVRWVVAAHVGLLAGAIALNRALLGSVATSLLDASVVIAQVMLLMIWMTLDETSSIFRFIGAAAIASGMALAHLASVGMETLYMVPAVFIVLNLLSLPMLLIGQAGLVVRRFRLHSLPPARRLQFSIRSVLVASITLAFLFGLGNLPHSSSAPDEPYPFDPISLVLLLVMLVAFLCIPVAAVWVVLRPGRILHRLAIALFASGLAGALVFHFNQRLGIPAQGLLLPALATAGGLIILLTTLLVLRWMGYRAVWLMEEAASHPDVRLAASPFASE